MGKRAAKRKLEVDLEYWETMTPCNGMGKWTRSVALKSVKQKLKQITPVRRASKKKSND